MDRSLMPEQTLFELPLRASSEKAFAGIPAHAHQPAAAPEKAPELAALISSRAEHAPPLECSARIHPQAASHTEDGRLALHVHLLGGPSHGVVTRIHPPCVTDIRRDGGTYALGYSRQMRRHVARWTGDTSPS